MRSGEQQAMGGRQGDLPAGPTGRLPAALRLGVVLGLALVCADCSSRMATSGRSGNKYGVKASPKVVPDGEPIPKGGGRAMVGNPYVVGGQTYVPTAGSGYVREGMASWYGTAFHGRLTANGEVFDRESIAAAHPTLPLPSYIRVTNLANRSSMVVRVNDRGPYEKGRLVDISERAADALGFHRVGTTRVRVEYLGKASLKGSDDTKLLATLRTDGTPAPYKTQNAVMVADLGTDAPPAARPSAVQPLAFRTAEARQASDYVPPAAAPDRLPGPMLVATTQPAPRMVADASDEPVGPDMVAGDGSEEVGSAATPQVPPVRTALAPPFREVSGVAPLSLAPPLPPERPILAGLYYAEPASRDEAVLSRLNPGSANALRAPRSGEPVGR